MKSHLPTATLAASLVTLVAPALAQAAPQTVADAARGIGMTPAELSAHTDLSPPRLGMYVAGAQSVGGLSPAELRVTLRRPSLIPAVPIATREGSTSAHGASTPTATASIAARGCRTTESFIWFKGVAGTQLWRFAQAKYWCWNKRTKRVDSKPNVMIKVRIRQAASIAGWDYKGLDEDGKDDHIIRWGNSRKGGHSSMRRGLFKFCPPKIFCFNTRRPTITLENHYDGTVRDERSVG